jgi:hypothetical protein
MIDTTRPSFVRPIVLSWIAGLVLLGTMSACDNGATPPLPSFDAVAYGAVRSADIQAVQGARVTVTAPAQCPDDQPAARFTEISNHEGMHRDEFGTFSPDTLRCLTINAEAPPESGLGDTTFTVEPVELVLREEPPFDSLRVDVTLPAQ